MKIKVSSADRESMCLTINENMVGDRIRKYYYRQNPIMRLRTEAEKNWKSIIMCFIIG